jgi:DNA-binding NarL/FixJ family response regulator
MTDASSTDLRSTDFRKDVRVLVVADHDDHYDQICEAAELYNPEFHLELQRVESRESLAELSESWQPTVVLLDIHILSDAFKLIEQLSHAGYPVVATSSVRVPEIAETAQQYGAVGYFNKSDNLDDIEVLFEYIASVASAPGEKH